MITNASCRKCAFFDDHAKAMAGAMAQNDGLCRYNPPVSQPAPTEHGLWPVVSVDDWCGHYTADPANSPAAAE